MFNEDMPTCGAPVMIHVIDGSEFIARRDRGKWLSVGSNTEVADDAVQAWRKLTKRQAKKAKL